MAGRAFPVRAEPGASLPAFERLAPPPPRDVVAGRIEALTVPGDVVLDLHGRGGWIGRAAVDRQRRAISLESSPLTRMLAEIVLRPPDLRHLDAAFQAMAGSPRRDTSLKLWIGDRFATRCATCGRTLVLDELIWQPVDPGPADRGGERGATGPRGGPGSGRGTDTADDAVPAESAQSADRADGAAESADIPDANGSGATAGSPDEAGPAAGPAPGPAASAGMTEPARPVTRHYRCTFCRDQRGGGEQRHAPPDDDDLARATSDDDDADAARRTIRERFPVVDGGDLVDDLLSLHTARQLIGLAAILERIEGDLRAAPVEAALRLALLHALLPASRLNAYPGRVASLRLQGGRVRLPSGSWRERNPWLAFEDGFRIVRGFIQRLEGGATGPLPARFGDDLRALVDGTAMASVRVGTASAYRALAAEARDASRALDRAGVRLVIAQPPLRPTLERLAFAYLATGWVLGREAASLLPLDSLSAPPVRVPWGWQSAALARSLGAAEPMLSRDGRAVLLCEPSGEEPIVAAVLGGVGAGYRLVSTRLAEPGEEAAVVELVPPGAALPPGPRTRANVALEPVAGGAGDPDLVPGRGLFAPPERFEGRPFSAPEAARTVTEAAVEVLKARGEPARTERLLGEILVGLDRAGHLRRLVAGGATNAASVGRAPSAPKGATAGEEATTPDGTGDAPPVSDIALSPAPEADRQRRDRSAPPPADGRNAPTARSAEHPGGTGIAEPELWERRPRDEDVAAGNVERLLALIREELGRSSQRRLVEIEPGRWWLADRTDREAAALPLADRVEWAVFSLLSTAGPLSEAAFLERIAGLFPGHDLPDETLVRACLESYRSFASTPDRLVSSDDLLRRTQEHTELLALLAELGHAMGFSVWLSRREQERVVRGHRLSEWLDARERSVHLPLIARAPADDLADVDAMWYVRGKATLHFEVEWTAMLSETVLRRHARIPGDEGTVRFLVIVPERTELIRHKLERSPVLRAALAEGNWHLLKVNHLRTFAALQERTLEALEPFLGLDPLVERSGEQLPLFEA
jgi:hypothetical protein